MTYLTIYLSGIVAMFGFFAWRESTADIRLVFKLSLIWPASIVVAVLIWSLDASGIDIQTAEGSKMFGTRRPTNPNCKGFAVTLFGTEFQFTKLVAK